MSFAGHHLLSTRDPVRIARQIPPAILKPQVQDRMQEELLQMRMYGRPDAQALVYLPGLHGDWTLITSFRRAVQENVRFVEFTYPRTLEWSLDDYATAIEKSLLGAGISTGWLLAESFGSQIAWQMVSLKFDVQGIVLAGGFVRHPMISTVHGCAWLMRKMPLSWLRTFLFVYAKYARFRHRHAPETMESVNEFISRRTELDKQAMAHRLRLIAENDPRPIARATRLPVYHLSGLIDPVVPWFAAQRWLIKNCPGCRARRVISKADHNVLGTAPKESAEQILKWMADSPAGPRTCPTSDTTPLPASQILPR